MLAGPVAVTPGRARTMASIRGKGNASTELRLAAALRLFRMSGWRRHLPLPGRPDFAWPGSKVAVFVDGCFWHGCPNCYQAPRHNPEFWKAKVEGNRRRDRRVARQLRACGWKVLRIWECRLGNAGTLSRLRRALGRS
ncbi:MAG: very short patch repair endonuclease [Gemmatimonadota bacterium]